ncbi:MAG: hypothetical protein WBA31_01300 [Candidatus Dormiibacterota bacterium]
MSSPTSVPPPDHGQAALPVLRMPSGRGQRRFTLLLGGVVVVLILIQVLGSHPLPPPSHRTATGAVAGYLEGVEHTHLEEVRQYLAPSQRFKAKALLHALATHRAYITAPQVGYESLGKTSAEVNISVEVCAPQSGTRIYSCTSIGRSPLGLPSQLKCVRVDGEWYVTTLFLPQ